MPRQMWVKEDRRSIYNEVAFWRNAIDNGYVVIFKLEPGAPGDDKFMVTINAPHQKGTRLAKTVTKARAIAKEYMEEYKKRVPYLTGRNVK